MVSWFNETNRGVDRDFKYRFTGQESNALIKHFPMLISKFILLLNDANIKALLAILLSIDSHQKVNLLLCKNY